jgi:TonB-linked SusC/RagA family outer membrane protein
VSVGTRKVIVRAFGYLQAMRIVRVEDNGAITLTVALRPAATMLSEIVTTGAGDRARVKVGNWVTTIDADSIMKTAPIRNLSDLLDGRAPGMNVQMASGTVGAGSKIRIRGLSSLLTNEDPIIIVDGVRVGGAFSRTGFGSSAPVVGTSYNEMPGSNQAATSSVSVPATSRLNDIDPTTIESIDVLRGPAASTLYGSDAANGVIVIKTKRGRPGPTRWSFTWERGLSSMDARFPEAYNGWGMGYGDVPYNNCTLVKAVGHVCTRDSVTHFNPLNDDATSPFTGGRSGRLSAQVSGGTGQLQYFLGATADDEVGMLHLPSSIAALTAQQLNGVPVPSWAKRPNTMRQLGATNTLTSQVGATADLSLATRASHIYQTNAPEGTDGIVGRAVSSLGYQDTVTGGWGPSSPIANFLTRYSNEVNRVSTAITAHWQPFTHLSGTGSGGIDYSNRDDQGLLRANLVIPNVLYNSLRNRSLGTMTVRNGNFGAVLDVPIRDNVRLRGSVGGQYSNALTSTVTTNASGLASGTDSYNSASFLYSYEFRSEWTTAGWYTEGTLELNQRLFLTAALRRDASSAFGQGAKPVSYPKISASWLVSQEPFFPRISGIESFRLRSAFGQAGSQPDVSARFLTYTTPGLAVSTSPTYVVNTIGNPDLLPERSQELEGGFDLALRDDRVVIEATFYNKITRDALVTRTLPSSIGIATQVQNIGKVQNRGTELTATLRPLTAAILDWRLTIGYAHNDNVVRRLGTAAQVVGLNGRIVEGYPVDGVWARAIVGVQDANGNGVIEPSELRLTDSAVYAGAGVPRNTFTWHNTIALFSGRMSLASAVSYRGGMTQVNGLLYQQCRVARCRGAVDPTASLALQTLAAAALGGSSTTVWPFLESTSVVRFDELSLTLTVPRRLAHHLRAQSATLSLLGRNLGVWTKYRGADPAVNSLYNDTASGDQFGDYGGVPQPRQWGFRVNLGY